MWEQQRYVEGELYGLINDDGQNWYNIALSELENRQNEAREYARIFNSIWFRENQTLTERQTRVDRFKIQSERNRLLGETIPIDPEEI